MRSPLLVLSCLILAAPALASDGVLEISQVCATQTGCFSGDTAGYPVTIDGSAGRSYRLTSDLVVPDENTDGILLAAPSLTIDLNGFAIVRSGCENEIGSCVPVSGSGSGVNDPSAFSLGISVRNGNVIGMGADGVRLGRQSEVMNVRARWNRNGGISVAAGSTVMNNTTFQNGFYGIQASGGSIVSGNAVYDNGGTGISSTGSSHVTGNNVYSNDVEGIVAGSGSIVSDNSVDSNSSNGIRTTGRSSLFRNSVNGNGALGLSMSASDSFGDNVVTRNSTAGQVSGGNPQGRNYCADSGTVNDICF